MTASPALLAHYAGGTSTLAWLLKLTRSDAAVFGFTSADFDIVDGGVIYKSAPGLSISQVVTSSSMNVDNLELSTLDDGSVFNKTDLLAGRWNNAAFAISRCNWADLSMGLDTKMVGTVGNASLLNGQIIFELRGLQQYLQQPVVDVTSKTCRARLGDSLCRVNLTSYTVTGTITSVTSKRQFRDSSRTEPYFYFAEGLITFNSGANAGLSQKVKVSYADGTIELMLPMIGTVAIGNTYTLVAGCSKRLVEDCAGKFNNVLNFQGEPHVPGLDALTAV